jgi:translation initiation factor eIF-2B subunit gamma
VSTGESLAAFKAAVAANALKQHRKARGERAPKIPFTCRVIVSKPAAPAAPVPAPPVKGSKGKAAPEPEAEYLLRANSIAAYWEMNRRIVRGLGAAYAAAGGAASGAPTPTGDDVAATAQISPDSLVGEGSRVGDKASIKKCVVGRHCNIGKGAKLTGCVLWDWVTVEDNARLENVILCGNVRIGEKANIKDCEFGPGFEAMPGATIKGERLMAGQEA